MARKKDRKRSRVTNSLRFIKDKWEFIPQAKVDVIPPWLRGFYVLSCKHGDSFNVVYIGMSCSGMRGRVGKHKRSKGKASLWTHCSVYEVHDNIFDQEIRELEGLFRQVYKHDKRANPLNLQRSYQPLQRMKGSFP